MDIVFKGFQDLRAVLQPNAPAVPVRGASGYTSGGDQLSPTARWLADPAAAWAAATATAAASPSNANQEDFAVAWKAFCSKNPRLRDPKVLPALMRRGVPEELRPEVWAHCLGVTVPAGSGGSSSSAGRVSPEKSPTESSKPLEDDGGPEGSADKESAEEDGGTDASTGAGGETAEEKTSTEGASTEQESDSSAATGLPHSILDVIEADVSRTFPNSKAFQESGGPDGLRRVLIDLAQRDTELGYCQSMNFIAAIFIIIFKHEQSARMALEQLVVKLGTRRWYTDGMKQLRADTAVLEDMLRERLPSVHSALRHHRFDLLFITSKWFLCLFAATLTDEVLCRVWDLFLGDGIEALFRVSIALFALQEEVITQAQSPDDLIRLMQDWHPACAPEVLIQNAYNPSLVGQISRKELDQRRRKAAEMISDADTRAEMRITHLKRGGVRPASILAR